MSSIKTLPSMETTFTIKSQGSDTGKIYEGTFTYKRPNFRIKSEISKTEARLNGDLKNLDEDMAFLHKVLSVLRHTLVNAPDWWVKADYGFDLYDVNVILEVWKACQDFEVKWSDSVWSEEPKKEEAPAEAK